RSRCVRRRNDNHRARQTLGSQVLLKELAHFTTALTNESDDNNVNLDTTYDHPEERRLADAGAGEETHALTASERSEYIDRPHARRQRFADALAAQGMRRLAHRGPATLDRHRPTLVERTSKRVEHAAEQRRPGDRNRRAITRRYRTARMKTGGVAQRHQQHAGALEADHFGHHFEIIPVRTQPAEIAEPDIRAVGFDDESRHRGDATHTLRRRRMAHLGA